MSRNDLFLASTRPNYYELLPQIEAAMAEADRVCRIRMEAGFAEFMQTYVPAPLPTA